MRERVHVVIRGRVQGVGFRFATYARAKSLGLTGWVRNCSDGNVEAEFEGPRADLEAMVKWCENGPPSADVRAVNTTWAAPRATPYNSFEISD